MALWSEIPVDLSISFQVTKNKWVQWDLAHCVDICVWIWLPLTLLCNVMCKTRFVRTLWLGQSSEVKDRQRTNYVSWSCRPHTQSLSNRRKPGRRHLSHSPLTSSSFVLQSCSDRFSFAKHTLFSSKMAASCSLLVNGHQCWWLVKVQSCRKLESCLMLTQTHTHTHLLVHQHTEMISDINRRIRTQQQMRTLPPWSIDNSINLFCDLLLGSNYLQLFFF